VQSPAIGPVSKAADAEEAEPRMRLIHNIRNKYLFIIFNLSALLSVVKILTGCTEILTYK
jgi:hypothetical protein